MTSMFQGIYELFFQKQTEQKLWSDFDDDFFASEEETDDFFKDDNDGPDSKKTDFKKQAEEDECDMTNNPAQFGYFLGLKTLKKSSAEF